MNDFNQEFKKLCAEAKVFGANIVVSNDKDILEKCSYGYADIDTKMESDENTIYRIASISKTVLAIGLMQLVEKGLVDLNEDISTYLGFKVRNPKYPDVPITVKMITTHTSSIQDGYDDENPAYDGITKGYNGVNGTLLDVPLETLLNDTTSEYYTKYTYGDYKPGTRFCYSNFGTGIMACIIEKASGKWYVEYTEENIFKPLGINASFKSSRLKNTENIANMYVLTSNGVKTYTRERFLDFKLPVFPLGNNYRGPAGGLFITMTDLSKIMRTLMSYGEFNGVRILKKETVEKMYQSEWIGTPHGDEYRGKAIQMRIIDTCNNFTMKGHTGGAYGVRSYMFFSIKYKIGACFITNGFNSIPVSKLCNELFDKSQDLWVSKYSSYKPSEITIEENKISTDYRTIIQDKLFINKENPYILAKALIDALDLLPEYKEDKYDLELKSNGKYVKITDLILLNDEVYIALDKTLKDLGIKYEVKEGKYVINF